MITLSKSALTAWICALFIALDAQSANAQQACTYDQCALRREQEKVLAGREAKPIGTLGFLDATDMTEIFAANDSAARYYRAFHNNYVAGSALNLVSTITFGGWWFFRKDLSTRAEIGFALTGLISGFFGSSLETKADEGLARAIWWYNRDLQR
ncbi:MAG TPA: hypothetical protein VGD27_10945 [Longimicrobiales bacterium]